MARYNICDNDSPCQHKGILEESYMDKLVSLYRAITGDTTIPSDDKVKIIEKIYALELLVERYSA